MTTVLGQAFAVLPLFLILYLHSQHLSSHVCEALDDPVCVRVPVLHITAFCRSVSCGVFARLFVGCWCLFRFLFYWASPFPISFFMFSIVCCRFAPRSFVGPLLFYFVFFCSVCLLSFSIVPSAICGVPFKFCYVGVHISSFDCCRWSPFAVLCLCDLLLPCHLVRPVVCSLVVLLPVRPRTFFEI